MNYYSHNIGDYAQATMHLSLIEDAIYTRLLRRYYAEEAPITDNIEQVCRWVGARSDEERAAVSVVLAEFFDLVDGLWRNKRADEEIATYQHKAETNRVNGKSGGRPPKKPKETQPVNSGLANETQEEPSRNPNQEPRTNNQETKDQEHTVAAAPDAVAKPADDLFAKFWKLYPVKKGKAKAEAAWSKLKVTDDLFTLITQGLARQVVCHDWAKEGGQYIPHPTTWLNGKRWEDEVKPAPSGNVHAFPGQSRHTGFDQRDYTSGLTQREDGTYAF